LDQEHRLYLEDLAAGQTFATGSHEIDADQIIAFARQFDPQPFHLDPEKARQTLFNGLAASGWHTAGITMRLLVDSGLPLAGGIIGAEATLKWPRPTRAGDVLTAYCEVTEVRASRSRPDRGWVEIRTETRNQHDQILQIFTSTLFVERRPAAT
jgi:acyl dehydratase